MTTCCPPAAPALFGQRELLPSFKISWAGPEYMNMHPPPPPINPLDPCMMLLAFSASQLHFLANKKC